MYQNGKSYVMVGDKRLYRIIDDASALPHRLEFVVPAAGLQAYTLTFG